MSIFSLLHNIPSWLQDIPPPDGGPVVAGEVGGAGGGVGEVPLPRRAAEAVRGPTRHKEIIRNAATGIVKL